MNLNRVGKIDGMIPIKNAIISVADKTGLEDLVKGLLALCPEITVFSTGGSFAAIEKFLGPRDSGLHLRSVSDYTGQPEMQGGLVKTLDFRIYLGLLSETRNPDHSADLERTGAVPFDLVVVNLYPFSESVSSSEASLEDARTHIDIGGPCMLRAAAKNFIRVAAVCDPADYRELLTELRENSGRIDISTRYRFSRKVFRHTAEYDAAIADYFACKDVDTLIKTYERV